MTLNFKNQFGRKRRFATPKLVQSPRLAALSCSLVQYGVLTACIVHSHQFLLRCSLHLWCHGQLHTHCSALRLCRHVDSAASTAAEPGGVSVVSDSVDWWSVLSSLLLCTQSGAAPLPPPPGYFAQQQQLHAQMMPGMMAPGGMPGMMMPMMGGGFPGAGGPGGFPGQQQRPHGFLGGPIGGVGGGAAAAPAAIAPTYVPPIPFPPEAELLSRPPPTANCDPMDETYPTYNIFVGDMTPDFTEADLYAAYQAAGPIHSVNVVKDKMTGAAKGFGFWSDRTHSAARGEQRMHAQGAPRG